MAVCRKSTFLNVLAGRVGVGTLSGQISVNGEPRVRSTWRKITAYVEQQEVMYKNLTVTETLTYGAQLPRVDDIIQELGLVKCKDTKIGDSDLRGISGGEKKRVSIGLELLSQPSILFLDEPTSGLDAFTAVNIISTISKIAKTRNACIVMTIHQPRTDILELCDKILLLAGGKTVFFGKLDNALTLSRVVTLDQRSKELLEESSPTGIQSVPGNKGRLRRARYNSSWMTQFGFCLGRNMKEVMRDPATIGASVGQGIFICILLDLTQGIQNRLGALFFIVVNQTFGVVMPNIGSIPLQRLIILRERSSGSYCASAAYLAKWVSGLPANLLGASVLALPSSKLLRLIQPSATRYLTFYCIVLVQTFAANGMECSIGSILGPLFITVFLIFGGNFLNLDSAPVVFRWIQWISIISYSNKALAQNELEGLTFTCPPQGQCLTDGRAVIANFALNTPGIWPCVFINIGLGMSFVLIGYFLFRQTSKPLLRLE
ncbi:P-loop containing nucleoside triphosphate hydrolase protein [Chytridium lagenaria]|nr:P-loop containing nucleoside triphosphate hydrolase protein [Chytridium lagenaria]